MQAKQELDKESWTAVEKDYKLLESVGEGSYGQVRKAKHIASRNKVAIKRITVDEESRLVWMKYIVREIGILRRLSKHQSNHFSVRLMDVVVPEGELESG